MIQFTIRDLMWAMMVAGFGLCWYLERDGRQGLRQRAMVLHKENETLRVQVLVAQSKTLRRRVEFRQLLREIGEKATANQSTQTE